MFWVDEFCIFIYNTYREFCRLQKQAVLFFLYRCFLEGDIWQIKMMIS